MADLQVHGKHTLDLGTQAVDRIEEPMGGHVPPSPPPFPCPWKNSCQSAHALKLSPSESMEMNLRI